MTDCVVFFAMHGRTLKQMTRPHMIFLSREKHQFMRTSSGENFTSVWPTLTSLAFFEASSTEEKKNGRAQNRALLRSCDSSGSKKQGREALISIKTGRF